MQYNAIYKNGKVERFFIKLDDERERYIVQLYFMATSPDEPKKYRINRMEWVFADTLCGKQRHGHGYSSSADVYGTLRCLIFDFASHYLSEAVLEEVSGMPTHDSALHLSDRALDEIVEVVKEYENINTKKY